MGKCDSWCHNKSIGLLLLRLSLGAFFIAHGVNKLQNIESMQQFFNSVGLTASFWPHVVGWGELLAGVAILLGAFMWIAAVVIAVVMALAILKVTWPNPSQQPALLHFISGWGPNVIYGTAALALAWCGAGKWSLTGWFLRQKGRSEDCKDCQADHK